MKIALIRPNMGNYRSSDAMTPLAMGILAGRSTGHEVVFYDDRVEPMPERIDADLVAISVETFTARRAYQIADQLRAQGTRVVLGGYHPTLLPQEAAAHADALITGDAEDVWAQLLHDAQCNQLQALYASPNRHDLTDYAMDRRIFANKRYAPIELVQYGRGCRFACDFCSIHRFYGHHVRVRPAADVRAELEQLNRKRLLFFVDDNLFSTEAQLLQLLDAIAPLRMRWSCQISIDVARNQHLLDRLAAAGCRYVLIGFESMERANLKQMGKGWNHVAGGYREWCAPCTSAASAFMAPLCLATTTTRPTPSPAAWTLPSKPNWTLPTSIHSRPRLALPCTNGCDKKTVSSPRNGGWTRTTAMAIPFSRPPACLPTT